MTFLEKLEKAIQTNNSLLSIGLDPDFDKLPESLRSKHNPLFEFNKEIIDRTHDLVCAYKPQIAGYSALGEQGTHALIQTIQYLVSNYPEIPIILDAKRADIADTSEKYSKEAFDVYEADAVTVNPYFGKDALLPFLKRRDKGIIVLCRTSNKSVEDFQDLDVDGEPLYIKVAKTVYKWHLEYGNCLLVVGATWPEQMKDIRAVAGDMFFLVPGVGAQGGDLELTLKNGLREDKSGLIIHSSRSIIYASNDEKFADAAKERSREIKRPNKYIPMSKTVLDILKENHAIITDDHFVYTSDRHGAVYINKDALYPHTDAASYVGSRFAEKFEDLDIDAVVAPAIGGIILSQWTAYHLSKLKKKEILGVYTEKTLEKNQIFTRGYDKLIRGKNILVIEDLTTTGGSVKKVINSILEHDGNIVAVGVMVNRDPKNVTSESIGYPFTALSELFVESYSADECPLCKKGIPINTSVGHGKKFLESK